MELEEMSPEMTAKISQLTAMIAEIMLMAYQEGLDHGLKMAEKQGDIMEEAIKAHFSTSPNKE